MLFTLESLEAAASKACLTLKQSRAAFQSRPWYQRLLGQQHDPAIKAQGLQFDSLTAERHGTRARLESLEGALQRAESVAKRLADARTARDRKMQIKQLEAERQNAYGEKSAAARNEEYRYEDFIIQKKDYRRGNAIDNYCRSELSGAIYEAFNGQCVSCGSPQRLTLDHFALTKNEGGNFVLVAKDGVCLAINVVVLCRSCNSIKAQRPHTAFFDALEREQIQKAHAKIMVAVRGDREFMTLIRNWVWRVSRRVLSG
jgi:5-methylcytosine-specific restriction endonuclease McrA